MCALQSSVLALIVCYFEAPRRCRHQPRYVGITWKQACSRHVRAEDCADLRPSEGMCAHAKEPVCAWRRMAEGGPAHGCKRGPREARMTV